MRRFLAIAMLSLASAGCLDFDQFGAGNTDGGPAALDGTVTLPDFATVPVDLGRPDDLKSTTPHDLLISYVDASPAGDLAPCQTGFIECQGSNALFCNDVQKEVLLSCNGPCRGPDDCGLCKPNTSYCDPNTGTYGLCTSIGGFPAMPMACPPPVGGGNMNMGQCANGACLQCINANNGSVCGDGNSGSVVDTQYTCTNGMLGNPQMCAYGCDPSTGHCRDLVPANQAAQHLAQADVFTCLNVNSMLSDLSTDAGHTFNFDTTNAVINLDGKALGNLNVRWGPPYIPLNSGSHVRVLHVRSINLNAADKVSVSGAYGLILLVDQNVNFTGALGQVTTINLAANLYTPGAGAPTATKGANGGSGGPNNITDNGGGGAGHGSNGGNGGGVANGVGPLGGGSYGDQHALEGGASGGGDGNTQGGAGGGALQITACGSFTVSQYVLFNASGGGGGAGFGAAQAANGGGGGGGGSGGTFIFEATKMSIGGEVVANGGGGGSGGVGNFGMVLAMSGANWDPSSPPSTPAPGGVGGGAAGGAGGAGMSLPVDGTTSKMQFVGSGGGGGAYGRIFLNTTPIMPMTAQPAGASPMTVNSFLCVTDKGQAPNPCVYQ
jgi:hypothetical protein